jgi:hypothetical protein
MKYKTRLHFLIAKIYKDILRRKIARLITWTPVSSLEPGCTAIIGMCSKLPYVLGSNLTCLNRCRWTDLKAVIITVDAEKKDLPEGFEAALLAQFPDLNITFCYYTAEQVAFAAKSKDPYIYSWLSWATCLNQVRTQTALIHDYDALVLSETALEKRYRAFVQSKAKIQGIAWYQVEGFIEADHLATTFEAFVDVAWLKSFPPIMGYNRVGVCQDRWVNYDTYLDIQANYTPENQRTIIPMKHDELAHPSQMITQYMRFKHTPGKRLACSSVIMIPFFYFLSGQQEAIRHATAVLNRANSSTVDLLDSGVLLNLALLNTKAIDFILKLALRVLIELDIAPFKDFVDYGTALYVFAKTPSEQIWVGDFTEAQRHWVNQAKADND